MTSWPRALPLILVGVAVFLAASTLPADALAQGDPCLEVLADDPEQLDRYDMLVNDYLQASAAADTEKQLTLLTELRGVCDQNLRLWAFEGNIHATSGNCEPATAAYQYVLEQAPGWPHPDNATDASSIAQKGLSGLAEVCGASISVECASGSSAQVDDGPMQPCPAVVPTTAGEHTVRVVDAQGNEVFAKTSTFSSGETVVNPSAAGGAGQGGGTAQGDGTQQGQGGGVVEEPVPEPEPTRSDMAIQLGAGAGIGLASFSVDLEGFSGEDSDLGFGWEVRGYGVFRFLQWLGIGLNAGYFSSAHDAGSASFGGIDASATNSIQAATIGAIVRFEFGNFIIAPWFNFAAGTTETEACQAGVCDTTESDISGFDIGADMFWAIGLFTNGFLEMGIELAYRAGEIDDPDLDAAGVTASGSQFFIGFGMRLHYEIPL